MAERLATEYVKTCLVLTEAEMLEFVQLFADHQVQLQVKILENGSQDVVFQDGMDEDIVLSFERTAGKYVCTGSCRFRSPKLVNLMRKAVSEFKGSAIVNRIYSGYIMVYHYNRGAVTKIIEVKDTRQKVVYEYKDSLEQLKLLFLKQDIETEIQLIQGQINEMLDLRNVSAGTDFIPQIDLRLQLLNHRLFILEV
jgi:hypothetical protein